MINKNINLFQGGKNVIIALQHLIACFGATTLVPILLGFEIPVALFSAGVGTLLFHWITKGKVPVFLGSSFAFIPVIGSVIASTNSIPQAQGGIIFAGLIYVIMGLVVQKFGVEKLSAILKPHVVGTMIVIIGFSLIPVAVDMSSSFVSIAALTALSILALMIIPKGFIKTIAIVLGIAIGYLAAYLAGIVDMTVFQNAEIISMPNFTPPTFSLSAILTISPVVIAVFMEHLGDITANQTIVGKNFIKDPGIGKTLMGDGIATIFAGFVGGPPNTTYSENTGVLAITKNYNPAILRLAAIFAIALAFFGKLGALLQTIPVPVMGGASLVLFGMIAKIGIETLWKDKIIKSFEKIITVVLMLGIGLNPFWDYQIGNVQLSGVAVAALVGIGISLIYNFIHIQEATE